MNLDSSYVIHRIGSKIREHRKAKNLRLVDLADAANISSAMLSKIENGRIIPTIPTLFDLIQVLEIEPQDFFAEINHDTKLTDYILIRKENYVPYVKEESAVGFQYKSILEYSLNGNAFQISIVTLQPGNTRPKVSTDAYEYLFLINGEVKYHLGEDVLTLKAGDSIFFDGNIPHVPINESKQEVTYIVIYFFLKKNEQEEEAPTSTKTTSRNQ